MKISGWGSFLLTLAVLMAGSAQAGDIANRARGDGDPIPWACVDFAGNWTADNGKQVVIEQRKCNWIKLKGAGGLNSDSTVIVPDDKIRTIAEEKFRGVVRYRWNSNEFGSILETSRVICYNNRTVEEYITLEQVNGNLLETTYRSTTMLNGDGKPRREVKQIQLRRRK